MRAGDQLATFSPLAKCEVEDPTSEPTAEAVMEMSSPDTLSSLMVPGNDTIVAALRNECAPPGERKVTFDLPPT